MLMILTLTCIVSEIFILEVRAQVGHVDWQDPKACAVVTQVLLAKDFGVQGWQIPAGYLVPPVSLHYGHTPWFEANASVNMSLYAAMMGRPRGLVQQEVTRCRCVHSNAHLHLTDKERKKRLHDSRPHSLYC